MLWNFGEADSGVYFETGTTKEKKDVVVFSDHIQEQPVKKETFVPKGCRAKEEKPAIPLDRKLLHHF